MNKATGAVLLFFGCMLMYLSIFGLTSMPFQVVGRSELGPLATSFIDTFDTLEYSRWAVTYYEVYTGEFYADGVLHYAWDTEPVGRPSDGWESVLCTSVETFDFSQGGEISLDIVSMTGGTQYVRIVEIGLYKTVFTTDGMGVRKNKYANYYTLFDYSETSPEVGSQADFEKFPGSLKLEVYPETQTIIGYADGVLIDEYSYVNCWGSTLTGMHLQMRAAVDENYWGHVTVDNYKVALVGESGGDTGDLKVIGYYDGDPITCKVYYVGPEGTSSQVSVPTSGYTWSNVPVGSYTVYGSSSYGSKTATATVVKDQTVTAQINFGGSDADNWLDFLNNPTIKAVMFVGGIGCLGLGLIGLLMGAGGRQKYQPMPWY